VALQDGSRSVSGDTAFLVAAAAAVATVLAASRLAIATGASVAAFVTWPYTVALAVAAVGIPSGRAMFRALGLALDHPTPVQQVRPRTPVTVVLSAASDATLASLRTQDYGGATGVVVAGAETIRPVTPLTLVVDSGVVLHPSALRLLVARLASSPDTVAVAAHSLVLATNTGVGAEAGAAAWTARPRRRPAHRDALRRPARGRQPVHPHSHRRPRRRARVGDARLARRGDVATARARFARRARTAGDRVRS
jgi:hypothetical protein